MNKTNNSVNVIPKKEKRSGKIHISESRPNKHLVVSGEKAKLEINREDGDICA